MDVIVGAGMHLGILPRLVNLREGGAGNGEAGKTYADHTAGDCFTKISSLQFELSFVHQAL